VLPVLISGCAQQVSPKGGEVDAESPVILSSNPQNESVNMTDQKITLEFDEYVQLKSASQQLIVSPPLKYPVEFKMKGKKLEVSWEDTLTENTTYLFQFGEGIVDVNENNPLDSNVFVFSTGLYLDSFSLKGEVVDANSMEPVAEAWVMLYLQDNDSLPYKEVPRYFGKTNENGTFLLNYLAKGDYKVFALKEEGSSYIYDAPTEQIGFLKEMIPSFSVSDSSLKDSSYVIRLFNEIDSTQYLLGSTQLGKNGLQLQFNAPVDSLYLEDLTGQWNVAMWSPIWGIFNDTVTYWFDTSLDYDSLKLKLVADDFVDTLFLRKPGSVKRKKRRNSDDIETENIALITGSTQKHYLPWKIRSSTPIVKLGSLDGIVFKEANDTLEVGPYLSFDEMALSIDYNWKQGQGYSLLIPDSVVFDRFGNTQDTLNFSIVTSRKEDFGQLAIEYNLPDFGHQYIWQLKLEERIVDERIIDPVGRVKYDFLATGEYTVKLLFDQNNNGIWDTGYYPAKRQPEKVTYFNEKVEIRSNWATEMKWSLTLDEKFTDSD
jgi:hypothetical protein